MSRPQAPSLTDAVASALRESCGQPLDFAGRVRAGHAAISRAVVEGYDLHAMWRESDPDKRLPGGYRRHQVVNDERFGFTVVVLLWEPGACTPIHDHDTWCVFGLLDGRLEVTNYAVLETPAAAGARNGGARAGGGGGAGGGDGDARIHLREASREHVLTGIIGDNLAADTEVHRVRNIDGRRAMSLHVYGRDLTQRRLFDGRGIVVDGKAHCFAFANSPAY